LRFLILILLSFTMVTMNILNAGYNVTIYSNDRNITITDVNSTDSNNTDFNLTKQEQKSKEAMKDELSEFNYLNYQDKEMITNEIINASRKYKDIDPEFIFAIIWTESRFKKNVVHKPFYYKGKRYQAIGIGGIVPEFWSKKLIADDVINNANDIKNVKEAIHSVAWILNHFTQKKGNASKESKMYYASKNYFGSDGYYPKSILKKYNQIKAS